MLHSKIEGEKDKRRTALSLSLGKGKKISHNQKKNYLLSKKMNYILHFFFYAIILCNEKWIWVAAQNSEAIH